MASAHELDLEKGEAVIDIDNHSLNNGAETLSTPASSDTPKSPSTSHTHSGSSTTSSSNPLIKSTQPTTKPPRIFTALTTTLRSFFHRKQGVTIPAAIITRVHEQPDGYPKLAAFLDSDDNFMTYRRFGYLQSRLLLEKQDDLRLLEDQLERLEYSYGQDTEKSRCLQTREDCDEPYAQQRQELLAQIERRFREYAALMVAARDMTSMNRPTSNEVRSVNRWVWQENPLMQAEQEFVLHKEDLVTLRAGREHAWLDVGLERLLHCLRCRFLVWVFRSKETQEKTDGKDAVMYYTRNRIERLAMSIVLLMILVLLVVPIYLLNHWSEVANDPRTNSVCIGILLVFTLAFAACISLFTRASRHEILAASAAYCAVLVVFIGNIGGGRFSGPS